MKIGIHKPEQNDIGKYIRLTTAGAEFGLAKYPIAKPIALNGIEPATRMPISSSGRDQRQAHATERRPNREQHQR